MLGNILAGRPKQREKKRCWRHALRCRHIPEDCGESGIFSTVYRRGKWHFRAGRIPNFSPVVEKAGTRIGGQMSGLEGNLSHSSRKDNAFSKLIRQGRK